MSTHKLIYVSQEIAPYLSVTGNAKLGRELPVAMQQRKCEVRTFMPDFGEVNERRNQLHEVIRLSGMNIVIGDSDHPLVVKVASMQPSRIQVYFMDSDDYFQKSAEDVDAFGSNRADNDERSIFFARGTMDTAKKLRWEPDIVHVTGWMCALVPLYLKRVYNDGPSFRSTKVVYQINPETETAPIDPTIFDKLKVEGVKPSDIKKLKEFATDNKFLHRAAITYCDALVFHGVEPDAELKEYAEGLGIPVLTLDGEDNHIDEYVALYDTLKPSK